MCYNCLGSIALQVALKTLLIKSMTSFCLFLFFENNKIQDDTCS